MVSATIHHEAPNAHVTTRRQQRIEQSRSENKYNHLGQSSYHEMD